MKNIKYFFDVLSPYAWLGWRPLMDLSVKTSRPLIPIPILFAACLKKYGHLGPAEIPPKRDWIIKDVCRRAHLLGLGQVKPPPAHPFNPLLALRTITAAEEMDLQKRQKLVETFLDAVWVEGSDVTDRQVISQLVGKAGYNAEELLSAATTDRIKLRLQEQTQKAIDAGVFGVPTILLDDSELFWGSDTADQILMHINGQDDKANVKQVVQAWKESSRYGKHREK